MDNIEITVFDEINDYKEKIYFFNLRQWIFAILIVISVVPTYILLKDKIGEDLTSYIVMAIAGILGFIGFVKIHQLPAEKIIPYWFRHIFLFSKPIKYITDKDYNDKDKLKKIKEQNKPKKEKKKGTVKAKKDVKSPKQSKEKIEEQKQEKLLKKAKKKYEKKPKKTVNKEKKKTNNEDELTKKLSKLTKEQQDALLKLLGK